MDDNRYSVLLIWPANASDRLDTWLWVTCGRRRGQAGELTGYESRQARTVLSTLIDQDYLTSESHRSSVRLGFPAKIIDRWFPRLYVAPAI
jgi:hypothetical protein